MVVVYCDAECDYNKNGKCAARSINITWDFHADVPICESWSPPEEEGMMYRQGILGRVLRRMLR